MVNRRKAIKRIFGLVLAGGAGYVGFKAFELHKVTNVKNFYDRKMLIADLADTIIPTTDTPGAKAAKVEDFIVSVLATCTTNVEQNLFLEGLEKIEAYCDRNYARPFSSCSATERIAVMASFEKSDLYDSKLLNKINNKFFGQPFFAKLKELTVQGYCNSLLGASDGLAYNYIPGHFNACVPLRPHQRSWATK